MPRRLGSAVAPLRRCKCHRDGGFPKTRGTPKSSKSWDVFSIETHGDLEIPRFRTPDHVNHLTLGDKCYPTRSLEIARWMISWKIPRKNGWWMMTGRFGTPILGNVQMLCCQPWLLSLFFASPRLLCQPSLSLRAHTVSATNLSNLLKLGIGTETPHTAALLLQFLQTTAHFGKTQ